MEGLQPRARYYSFHYQLLYNPKQTVSNFNKNFSPVFDRGTKSTGQVSGVDWNTNEIETQFRLILDNTSCFWKAATPTNDS